MSDWPQVNPNLGRQRLTKAKGYKYKTQLGGAPIYTRKPYFVFDGENTKFYRQDKIHPMSNQYIWAEAPKAELDEMLDYSKGLELPEFLNRKLWSESDRRRCRKVWDEVQHKERERRAQLRLKTDAEIFRKTRHAKRIKEIKAVLRAQRKHLRDERKARGVRRRRIAGEHDELVFTQLKGGAETTGQIAKKTGLESKMVRRSLKRLLTAGKATKVSARVYAPTKEKAPEKPTEGPQKPRGKRPRLDKAQARLPRRKVGAGKRSYAERKADFLEEMKRQGLSKKDLDHYASKSVKVIRRALSSKK